MMAEQGAQGVADEVREGSESGEAARSGRRIVAVALMMAMAVAALEQTVVSTAMPTIIAQLRGLEIYPWVFSAYLLAATVTTPLYGKLADRLGRKRVLLFGLGLFGLGSALSGLSRSMPELIGMRALQGLGAGAIGPIVLTMIGDLYTLRERARVQGLFSGVWGVSSLAGPALGGVLTDYLSWRWVFFVTVPFAAVAAWLLARHVHETVQHKVVAPIDGAGAALLAGGSGALLMAVLGGEGRPAWQTAAWLGAAAVLVVWLVRQERRAADPVLPLDLLARPTIAAAVVGSFALGGVLFGVDTYVPLFVQGVLGGTATDAGRMITPLFLTWSVSVAVAAAVVVRLGYRATALVGSGLIALGMVAVAWGSLRPALARPAFAVGLVVMGLGMGPTSLSQILSVQNAVPWGRRGAATGAVVFFRTIGGALGVGVLGATLGLELAHRLSASRGLDVAAALRPETHARLAPAALATVRSAMGLSLRDVYLQMVALALLGLACSARLPRGRADKPREPAAEGDLLAAAGGEL
jgi:multidrug resistance protein